MPQSHKHKQLRAAETSLSDCALNDLSQKTRQTAIVPVTKPRPAESNTSNIVWGAPSSHLIQRYIQHRALPVNPWLLHSNAGNNLLLVHDPHMMRLRLEPGCCSTAKKVIVKRKGEQSSWEQKFGALTFLVQRTWTRKLLKLVLSVLKCTHCKCVIECFALEASSACFCAFLKNVGL